MNSKTPRVSSPSPEQTRPRLLPRSPALAAAAYSPGAIALTLDVHQSSVLATTRIPIGLLNPFADRLGRRLKFLGELLGRTASPNQLHHLSPEFRRIRCM